MINGRTMIPARTVAEALGAKVEWDEENSIVKITPEVKPYRFLKVDGDQTPWLYWEEEGRLFVEVHNLTEMIKLRYAKKSVSLAYSSNILIIDNRSLSLPVKMFGNFKATPVDTVYFNTGMLNFEWDSAAGNLKYKN